MYFVLGFFIFTAARLAATTAPGHVAAHAATHAVGDSPFAWALPFAQLLL